MTIKNKRTPIQPTDYLIVTPLSIRACLNEMKALANFDLAVHINDQSDYHAEVQFIERHNDDLPVYITSRLIATQTGTCVTFEVSEYLRESNTRRIPKIAHNWQFLFPVILMAGIFLMVSQVREAFVSLVCMGPFLYMMSILEAEMKSDPQPNVKIDTAKIRRLMRQRADILKGDLYHALHVDPSEVRQDELGNEYYVDLVNGSADNKIPDMRER